MINAQTEVSDINLNALCVALVKHAKLLKSGLTPYEAQCAIFTPEVEQALEAATPRMQESFGLYMQYQVEQAKREESASLDAIAHSVISMRDFIAKKYQQQAIAPTQTRRLARSY